MAAAAGGATLNVDQHHREGLAVGMNRRNARQRQIAAPAIVAPRANAAGKEPPKHNSLVAKAYEAIKEKIITLYFLPGQYLNEAAISALLQVGRTPVHQALQRLELEGLVEIMPRKGVIVLPDSISEIIKILESRAAVEAELAKAAAGRVSTEDGKELLALANATRNARSGPGLDQFIACDRAFHRKLSEHAGNSVLSDFAQQLHERSIRYWYLHLWQTMDVEATTRQHAAIADAIAKHDGERAASAMREHIDSLKSRLMQVKDATRRYGQVPIR
jgi:GntR family transcriptional regulator, rspAB operon transcriptional repressor